MRAWAAAAALICILIFGVFDGLPKVFAREKPSAKASFPPSARIILISDRSDDVESLPSGVNLHRLVALKGISPVRVEEVFLTTLQSYVEVFLEPKGQISGNWTIGALNEANASDLLYSSRRGANVLGYKNRGELFPNFNVPEWNLKAAHYDLGSVGGDKFIPCEPRLFVDQIPLSDTNRSENARKESQPKRVIGDRVTKAPLPDGFIRATIWMFIAGLLCGLEAVLVLLGWHRDPKRSSHANNSASNQKRQH